MQSQYWSGTQTGPANSAVNYACVNHGGRAFLVAEALALQVISAPGAISGLRIRLDPAPGVGKSWTFKLRKNGADTALSVTVSGAATTGVDLTNAITVAAGDTLSLASSSTGTPTTTPEAQWTFRFDGDNVGESALLSCGYTGTMQAAGQTNALYPSGNAASTGVLAQRQQIVTTPGTITRFIARVPAAMGVGTWTVTLQKNGVDTAMTGAITVQSVTVNGSVAVVAGDLIGYKIIGSGSPVAQAISIGSTFKADTDGLSMILGGSGTNPSNSSVTHNHTTGGNESVNSGADNRAGLASACEVRGLYIQAITTPVGGDSWTVDYIKNVAGAVAFGHVTTDGNVQNPGALAVAIADADWLAVRTTPAGTPAASQLRWSITIFVQPHVITTNSSGEASALTGSTGWEGPIQTNSAGLTTNAAGSTGYSATIQTNSAGLTTAGVGSVGVEGFAQTNSAGLTTDGVGTTGDAIVGAIATEQGGLTTAGVGTVGSAPIPPPVDLPPATGGPARPFPIPFPMPIRMVPRVVGTIETDSAGITTHGIGFVGRPQEPLPPVKAPLPDKTLRIAKRGRKARPLKRSPHARPEPITGVCFTQSLAESSDAKGAVALADDEAALLLSLLS